MMTAILFALAMRVAAIAKTTDAVIGVAAIDLDHDKHFAVRGDERFPMGSVYKLPIALTVLRRVDRGQLSLDQRETIPPDEFAPGWSPLRDEAKGQPVTRPLGDLLRDMLGVSDNSASDRLLRLAGGADAVTNRMRELGVKNIDINRSETQIAADIKRDGVARYFVDRRDTATPNALADLLRRIARNQDGLTPASHALLLRIMTESATSQRIRVAAPPGTIVAHKSGMMPGTINDIGLATSADGKRHFAIVIMTKAGARDSAQHRSDMFNQLARAVWEELAKR